MNGQQCSLCGHITNDGVWCESPHDDGRCFLACWFCFQGLIYEGRSIPAWIVADRGLKQHD